MGDTLFIIEIQTADGTCAVHEVKDEIRVLGRSKSSADIMLEDKKVSGQHVELRYVDGTVHLRDLGSTNGTYFCDARIHDSVEVKPGEAFQMGDANIRIIAIFGADDADDAKTMVSMPAWMDEQDDLGADSTRALSADEIAAVMAATRQPTSELSLPENGGVEIDAVLAPVPESVDSSEATPDSPTEESIDVIEPGYVEEPLAPQNNEMALEPHNRSVEDLSEEPGPRMDNRRKNANPGGSAKKVLKVARIAGQYTVQYTIALSGALWRLAKWSFRAISGLITQIKERSKPSE
jgi:predicted component of type VI protein secretion system